MPAGRPALFKTLEDLEQAVEEYFDGGNNYSITGLALHLGFESRQSFYDYEKNEEFTYTIKKARTRIEAYYEENLLSKNATGAIFALKNFGWTDKQEIQHSGEMGIIWNEIKNYGAEPQADPGT